MKRRNEKLAQDASANERPRSHIDATGDDMFREEAVIDESESSDNGYTASK